MGIVTEYPAGFIIFCLLLGAVYAFFLYFRTAKDEINKTMVTIMTGFRFLAVSLVAFLLLSPLIKKQTEIIQKPLIIIAQDNTLSIRLSKDSAFYKTDYSKELKELGDALRKKYDVAGFSFGDHLSDNLITSYDEKETDISDLLNEVNTRYVNRNVGALILASDGIYNKGNNPFYTAEKIHFPIFTIAMGDTNLPHDLILKKINANKSVFLGDKFPVEIMIEADKCENESSVLEVRRGEETVFSKPIKFTGYRDFHKVDLMLEAKSKGLQRYTIAIRPVKGEVSTLNNSEDLFIDVNDLRSKIAIIYQSPHPDVFALKQALEGSARYEVTTFRQDLFDKQPSAYDLIILDQIPPIQGYSNPSRFSSVPVLYIIGTQTNIDAFNALKTGLAISSSKMSFTETLPVLNDAFSLFTLEADLKEVVKNFPPLLSPLGTYQYSTVADILLYQKIGSISTKYPLIFFFQNQDHKTGIITGENIWKWRLSDYEQKGDHKVFDDLINKIVRYLIVKGDKSFFKVNIGNRFAENEDVDIEAAVYNESYEMINSDDVNVTITDENKRSYPFVLGKTEKAYYLNVAKFPVGKYTWTANVRTGKDSFTRNGEFIVTPVNLELLNSVADHNLLFRIAKAHDAEMFYPHDLTGLRKKILEREDIRPVSYSQNRFLDLSRDLWLFLVILSLISAEWFLRKRNGVY